MDHLPTQSLHDTKSFSLKNKLNYTKLHSIFSTLHLVEVFNVQLSTSETPIRYFVTFISTSGFAITHVVVSVRQPITEHFQFVYIGAKIGQKN